MPEVKDGRLALGPKVKVIELPIILYDQWTWDFPIPVVGRCDERADFLEGGIEEIVEVLATNQEPGAWHQLRKPEDTGSCSYRLARANGSTPSNASLRRENELFLKRIVLE